ncbi:hypothetical protein PAPYR_2212 [Paratrimastix pyriformis]|uniref:Uncharacterized protein n=1 Tax=Paratrimastix pyriformis TaxID=342808 RepID=A0ABQ8UV01_9EUKA|nr:hypothetical protein PAPYR_2212 [Paratrimastix pyriformis]
MQVSRGCGYCSATVTGTQLHKLGLSTTSTTGDRVWDVPRGLPKRAVQMLAIPAIDVIRKGHERFQELPVPALSLAVGASEYITLVGNPTAGHTRPVLVAVPVPSCGFDK